MRGNAWPRNGFEDSNIYLVCFKNGIYDLKTNIFRSGYPEDFISKCIPINYKVYVDQAAKDAGGREIINEWDESEAGADTDITDGNILAVAEAKITAKLAG